MGDLTFCHRNVLVEIFPEPVPVCFFLFLNVRVVVEQFVVLRHVIFSFSVIDTRFLEFKGLLDILIQPVFIYF